MRGFPQGREDPGVGAGPLVHPTRPRPRPRPHQHGSGVVGKTGTVTSRGFCRSRGPSSGGLREGLVRWHLGRDLQEGEQLGGGCGEDLGFGPGGLAAEK